MRFSVGRRRSRSLLVPHKGSHRVTVRTDELAFRDLVDHAFPVSAVHEVADRIALRATRKVVERHRGRMEESATVRAGFCPFEVTDPGDEAALSQALLSKPDRSTTAVVRGVPLALARLAPRLLSVTSAVEIRKRLCLRAARTPLDGRFRANGAQSRDDSTSVRLWKQRVPQPTAGDPRRMRRRMEANVIAARTQSGWRDSNPRPQRPERCALPSCATPRGLACS